LIDIEVHGTERVMYRELSSLSEKKCELGWGIKMRLCKLEVHE
jgi:hypothetical protein